MRFSFTTHAASGAAVAPSSAFENADLRIYKDGSATQRSSSSGITMTSPFDTVTGLHHVDIDLSDNTDAGFYAAGSFYEVHLVPDETVDSLAVVKVLAYFDIGVPVANVTQFGGTAGTFSGGRPEVNTSHIGGTLQTANDVGADVDAILVDTGTTLQGELDGIQADTEDIQSRLPSALTADGNIKADTLRIGGTLQTANDVGADVDAILVDTAEIGAAGAGLTALASQASVNTIDDFLDTEIAAILEDTGTTVDDLVDDLEGRLTAALATALQAHALGVGRGVVDALSSTTAVIFKTVNGAAASGTDDFYNGRHIVFTSGALTLQATSITDYTGATKTATVAALTGAPAEDVTFIII